MADESNGRDMTTMMIDEIYEFSAPRFYDFTKGESDEETLKAELWFDQALSYAPSPFMPRIKTGRSFKVESLCDFSEAEQKQEVTESSSDSPSPSSSSEIKPQVEIMNSTETKEKETTLQEANKENNANLVNVSCQEDKMETIRAEETERSSSSIKTEIAGSRGKSKTETCCTPEPPVASQKEGLLTNSKKHQSGRHIATLVRNPSALKPKNQSQSSQVKGFKPESVKRETKIKNTPGASILAQENQAIKRQKLEGGRSREILNVKPPQPLHHKSKLGLVSGSSNSSVANKMKKEERKVYVREQPAPFVSMAEMMKKFQSSTRDLSLPHIKKSSFSHDGDASVIRRKTQLTLTTPKEPEFETAQRVRSVRIKSSAELEEEMMAKIPKFKARPLNKKILEAPTLSAVPRSTPQLPEFKEFHLETAARATQNADSASVASTEVSHKSQWKPNCLTEPKAPVLHTTLRARPPKVKSSSELEKEELENIPKFKARPLNKKIFESKGELGLFCNVKKHVTIPQEFHFATNERIPPPAAVADLFDKLSLTSEPRHDNPLPRNTVPNPFHLHTEERGAGKERKFVMELVQKQIEEEKARVPKANPYPYTTDYPVIPPKPEPKPCTQPEPFQLESLVRHEEEMQREMEERHRIEKEEEERRIFKAHPILKEDPVPLPEKVRKPLTQVQQINLHVDHRAVDRAEFDHKVKEKELLYKRYREESEAAKMIEEEKALKQMRRTMVPHARPVPNFDHPFCPKKSTKGATKAKSPNLRVLRRKERQRMLVNAVSSPASFMR
ncbi:protein TPX2 [Ricinus communis]|uniref:protein TPX2 n=1 Tax=Ricinus communis TaxID=3988 RepID=UPI00077230F3|nr:protein TPX2 [Ricinus communis]|eukprot:XP_015574010.1 protein TPX2 [Ricinus communis]